ERVLWWKLRLPGYAQDGVLDLAQRFLDIPRFHPHVQRLDIYYLLEPQDPVPNVFASLLERLSNLLALKLEIYREAEEFYLAYDSRVAIRCRSIFQNCLFQL